jgi:hypothetical protein
MKKWKFLPPPGLELQPLGRPSHSQSLYRLRYAGSIEVTSSVENHPSDGRKRKTLSPQSKQPAFEMYCTTWYVRLLSPAEYMHLAHGYSAECTFQCLPWSCLFEPNRKPLISFGPVSTEHLIYVYWNYLFFDRLDPLASPSCKPILKLGILQTVGRAPWTGKQPIARPLPAQVNKSIRKSHT